MPESFIRIYALNVYFLLCPYYEVTIALFCAKELALYPRSKTNSHVSCYVQPDSSRNDRVSERTFHHFQLSRSWCL